MNRFYQSTVFMLLFMLLVGTAFHQAHAQYVRPDGSFFIRPHVGLSSYLGDNEQSPVNFNFDAFKVGDKVPFSAGVEAGYQFTPRWSLSGAYYLADYPVIFQRGDRLEPHEDANTLRHTAALLARYTFNGESWRVAPYLQAGFNASFGTTPRLNDKIGYGPSVGAGLDVALSRRTSLMLEWNANTSFPDDAIDATTQNGFGNFDVLSAFSAGLKFNFREPFVPVHVLTASGPDTLEVGQDGLFTATTNMEAATTPVTHTWDFGDGMASSGLTATHAFAVPGTYTVTFTASNQRSTDATSMLVTVLPPPLPANIVALSVDPMMPDTQTPVMFTAEVAGDAPIAYVWDLGDGTTSVDAQPAHVYREPGTYTVTLQAANVAGIDEQSITVAVARYEPAFCADLLEMNTVYFLENESMLTEEGKTVLRENLEVLAACWSVPTAVQGWAAPGERMPEALSRARAEAVKAFYVANGIEADRLQALGMGVADAPTTRKVNGGPYRRVDTVPNR